MMNWVWDNAPYQGSELIALLAIADWCNDQGQTAFGPRGPVLESLARRARLGVRATQYVVGRLERDGAIVRVVSGAGRGNQAQWQVVMTPVDNRIERVQAAAPFEGSEKVQNQIRKGAKPDPKGCKPLHLFDPASILRSIIRKNVSEPDGFQPVDRERRKAEIRRQTEALR